MLESIGAAMERLITYQDKVEAIARNIANTGTFGYRSIDARFRSTFRHAFTEASASGSPAPSRAPGDASGAPSAAGAISAAEALDMGALALPRLQVEGQLVETGRNTDFALRGDGFFTVRAPDGQTFYTRDGRFSVDGEGRLVTDSGGLVELDWSGGEQDLTGKSFRIDRKGSLILDGQPAGPSGGPTGTGETVVARLRLATFDRPEGLKSEAGVNFAATAASGAARPATADGVKLEVIQGFLESSNVDVIGDMTDLLAAQRSYEMVLRAIQQTDAMMGLANNIRR